MKVMQHCTHSWKCTLLVKHVTFVLQPQSTAGGLSSSNTECVDTFTFRYPTVDICTTSVSYMYMYDGVIITLPSVIFHTPVSILNDNGHFEQPTTSQGAQEKSRVALFESSQPNLV